ncbi:MAG: RES family NAD+ phosphorylase [Rhodospirillaceae bacterium]|nr:RES family NAD+ phosphorylase [Rhodospirillaceae bacterium]
MKLVNFSERYGESGGLNYLLDIPIDQRDELSQEQIDQAVWGDIDNAFSRPVSANDEHLNYVPTQILAESLLVEKYDRIIYKSALSEKGYNIALFDVSSATFGAARLFNVTNVRYEFTEHVNAWFPEGGNYVTPVMTNIRPIEDTPDKEEDKASRFPDLV